MSNLIEIEEAISGAIISDNQIEKDYAVGIDFGTTYSVICSVDADGNHFFSDKDGILIPSVIAVDKNNEYILVGQDALRKIGNKDYAIIYSVKRLIAEDLASSQTKAIGENISIVLHENQPKILIFGQHYTIPDFVAFILTYLKGIAEKELGKKISKAVITVPARFDDGARAIIKIAAQAIGLDVLRIINEPTAAALAYGVDEKKEGIYVVYDLGGGTFDVSVLRMQMGVCQVLATCGDINLGGDDFDRILLDLINKKSGKNWHLGQHKLEIQNLKHNICQNGRAGIDADGAFIEISLEQFEAGISDLVKRTVDITELAIYEAKQKEPKFDLQGIILVGGSTRIKAITYILQSNFKCDIFQDLNPDIIVALGAGIKADSLNGGNNKNMLIDITPLSIGIEMVGGIVEKIIPRNTAIPASVSQEFTTFKPNQTGIDFHIVQGERELATDCRSLGRLLIRGIPPMEAGIAKVLVNFKIDSDGILTVIAKEKTTGKVQSVEIKPSYGINIEDIKTMLYSAMNNAKQDIINRLLKETKTESQAIIEAAKQGITKDWELLAEEERIIIEDSILVLENALQDSDNREEITLLTKALESALSGFVERRMNKYVQLALMGNNVYDL